MPRVAANTRKTAPAKTPVKATRTRRATVEETPAKPTRGRKTPAQPVAKTKTTAPAKRTPAPRTPAKTAAAPKRTRVTAQVEVAPATGADRDELTGFIIGSDIHIVAQELMAGGADRQEIIDRVRGMLDAETRTGTPKPVANVVGAVLRKLQAQGFTLESHFIVTPPAPVAPKKGRGRRA